MFAESGQLTPEYLAHTNVGAGFGLKKIVNMDFAVNNRDVGVFRVVTNIWRVFFVASMLSSHTYAPSKVAASSDAESFCVSDSRLHLPKSTSHSTVGRSIFMNIHIAEVINFSVQMFLVPLVLY